MAKSPIAVVATAANYASGSSVSSLWSGVLHQRTFFRDLPSERLPVGEYIDKTGVKVDSATVSSAAVLEGWAFDLAKYRIPRETYDSADLAHWLALDTCQTLLDELPPTILNDVNEDKIGVVLGNTLTGETSRANSLRLRWPYIQRTLLRTARENGVELTAEFVSALESQFKAPFPEPGTDSLAGGLANTIAGRLTNYYDWHGGGFTVDGACASSLLSVANVVAALEREDLDLGIAGGVDMSLDPFELVGFSRLGAMSSDTMRVYDRNSSGFLPGEGCGLLALMRLETAERLGVTPLALISGVGISSDGAGGLTRPAELGHRLAAQRAYAAANIDPARIGLFEGHGTGTVVGDEAELNVFATLRPEDAPPAAVGSIKANIGHTKAAAGAAGLIKAVESVRNAILPPATGIAHPAARLTSSNNLTALRAPEPWDQDARVAAVSALGFGGINTHIVVSSTPSSFMPAVRIPEGTGTASVLRRKFV